MLDLTASWHDSNAQETAARTALVRYGTIAFLATLPALLGLALAPCAPVRASTGGGTDAASEYELKAAFLFDFGKFVEWPANTFPDPNAPFSVCVLGRDPFGSALDQTLQGKRMENRPVRILRLTDPAAARPCQIVFVSASERPRVAAILVSLRGSNALVVGETRGFAESGGAIQFTVDDNHVRFTINPDAIQRAGLRISSQLLALAKIVHDVQGEGKG